MDWCDGHLDLAYVAVCGRNLIRPVEDASTACISLPAMREAAIGLAFGTIFTEPGKGIPAGYDGPDDLDGADSAGREQLAIYQELVAAGEISMVRTRYDLDRGPADPKIVLLVEGADPVGRPEDMKWWYDAGVRVVGMAWSRGSRYAGGNAEDRGLTDLGRELIRRMDELGVVHDVSHLSDASFDGLMETARGRIVATHSNCRALFDKGSQRMLRDDQIQAIAERDGIVGLNLYGPQLVAGRRATIADCVAHVERVCDLMGHKRGTALGSDMDGGFGPADLPEGLEHPRKLGALVDALQDAGWSDDEITGFCRGNWLRLLREVLPA